MVAARFAVQLVELENIEPMYDAFEMRSSPEAA